MDQNINKICTQIFNIYQCLLGSEDITKFETETKMKACMMSYLIIL